MSRGRGEAQGWQPVGLLLGINVLFFPEFSNVATFHRNTVGRAYGVHIVGLMASAASAAASAEIQNGSLPSSW